MINKWLKIVNKTGCILASEILNNVEGKMAELEE
jgi:hypothetical protein